MSKKISVIVPVYNAGAFLRECVESILKQKDARYELLLIDNGSTDGSRELCEQYAAEYDSVRVTYESERGASAVRNRGLAEAEGEYVVFVDADDYVLEEDTFSYLVEEMETSGADIAVGNYFRLWNGKLLPAKKHDSFSGKDTGSPSFWFEGFYSGGTLSYVWCKMYRRSFLQEHSIRFGSYTYAEDKMFNMICYLHGARYTFVDRQVYVYRKNDASVSFGYREDSCRCWMQLAMDLQDFLDENRLEKYSGLVANTIFFAVFFDAKMRYVHDGNKLSAVKSVLREYRSYPLARRYFGEFARGKRLGEIPSMLWRVMIFGFSVAMALHFDFLLALGIKVLVDARVDERLSDTGTRE